MSYGAESRSALDTQSEGPLFVPYDEHEAALAIVMQTTRERDELARAVDGLRRDASQVEQLRAQLDDARARMGRTAIGVPRELLEARDTLDAREGEIRRLKEANLAREKLLADARDRIEALMHERSGADARVATREKALVETEARAKDRERRCAELQAQLADIGDIAAERESQRDRALESLRSAEALATGTESALRHDLARAHEAISNAHLQHAETLAALQAHHAQALDAAREREEALAQETAEARSEVDRLAREQASLHDVHATLSAEYLDAVSALASLSADHASLTARHVALASDHALEQASRVRGQEALATARALHAETLDAATTAHAEAVASLEAAHAEAQAANADLARHLEAEKEARAIDTAAFEESAERQVASLEGAHAAEIMTVREAHAHDVSSLLAARQQDLAALRGEHREAIEAERCASAAREGTLFGALARRADEHAATIDAALDASARAHAEVAAARDALDAQRAAELEALEAAQAIALESRDAAIATRDRDHAATLAKSEREHADLLTLRGAEAIDEITRLEAAREMLVSEHATAIATLCSSHASTLLGVRSEAAAVADDGELERDGLRARVVVVERERDEARGQRDRASQKLGDAMRKLADGRRHSDGESTALVGEVKKLSRLVAELTVALVTQAALVHSQRHGHDSPEPSDVDAAIDALSEDLPESVTEDLWAARDAILERATAERFG